MRCAAAPPKWQIARIVGERFPQFAARVDAQRTAIPKTIGAGMLSSGFLTTVA